MNFSLHKIIKEQKLAKEMTFLYSNKRYALTKEALKATRMKQRVGVIAGEGRDGKTWRMLWEGRKSKESWSKDYIKLSK